MTLIELGERFSGSMLVAGNAAFSLMWGVGGIAVPPAAGAAMDLLGAQGLPLALGADLPRAGASRIARCRDARGWLEAGRSLDYSLAHAPRTTLSAKTHGRRDPVAADAACRAAAALRPHRLFAAAPPLNPPRPLPD